MTCPKVCIFDIDNTVTVGPDHDDKVCPVVTPGPKPAWPDSGSGTTRIVKDAIAKCLASGYKVAFASAESRSEEDNVKQRAFIASLAPNEEFDEHFLNSDAMQSSWKVLKHSTADAKVEFPHKQSMILNIMRHYGVEPSCFGESILFDDELKNLCDVQSLGLKGVQASLDCGGTYCKTGCGLPASALSAII